MESVPYQYSYGQKEHRNPDQKRSHGSQFKRQTSSFSIPSGGRAQAFYYEKNLTATPDATDKGHDFSRKSQTPQMRQGDNLRVLLPKGRSTKQASSRKSCTHPEAVQSHLNDELQVA
ncbi:unnamed protein product [Taenia asiatica]|uniref:Ovule protein n=1 Tax=Taenia asiatica TaxID=60517 RepID=A0A0R3VZJ0_TAEAS|nr:unnamed protein product [Taenia asiatica]